MSMLNRAFQLASSLFTGDRNINAETVILNDEDMRENIKKDFEKKIILDITQRYRQRKKLRNNLDLQNRLNINFYNGEQFTNIDSAKNDIEEVLPLNEWEERNVFNEISPCVDTRLASLSRLKNNLKCRPASAASEDRTSAKIGNKVLASTRARLHMSELQQEANLIAGIMGTAIWKTVWSSSSGRVVGVEMREVGEDEVANLTTFEYENELLGYDKNTVIRKIHEGDVMISVHSPFEIYPENPSMPLRHQRRIMHVILMPPDEVFEKWGVVVKGKQHETYRINTSNTRNYGSAITGRTYGNIFAHSIVENTVEIYEEWELPSPRYPEGRLIICCEEALLYYGILPDALGENGEYILPFDVQQSVRTDGFFGMSVIERMIPVQIKFNSNMNRIQDHLNRTTIGVLEAEENSLIDEDYFRENGIAPGEIIMYRRGANSPRFLVTADLPADMQYQIREMKEMFNRLSGVSDYTKQSTVPSQVTSGVAMASLAEQDNTRIGLEAENTKKCLICVGKKILILNRNNVTYARQVEDIGRNNEFEISQFVGSDLTCFDVFVESEPESSDTLTQRRQRVIELLNGGLFNDTETGNITKEGRIKVFEMLELGDWENFDDADDDQRKRAQRENNSMITGELATLREFDDDMIHISVHNNFRLKAEYEDAISKNPDIDRLFETHVNEHLQSLQIKQQAEIQSQKNEPYINRSKISAESFVNE